MGLARHPATDSRGIFHLRSEVANLNTAPTISGDEPLHGLSLYRCQKGASLHTNGVKPWRWVNQLVVFAVVD